MMFIHLLQFISPTRWLSGRAYRVLARIALCMLAALSLSRVKAYDTQIEAHLSRFKPKIQQTFFNHYSTGITGTPETHPIIKTMLAHAKKHSATHYEFYHAQTSEHRLFQDVYKDVREFLDVTVFSNEFHFLRIDDAVFSQYSGINQFLSEKINTKSRLSDGDPDMYTSLLSTNFSPFGNFDSEGESTFSYYLANRSIHSVTSSLFEKILNALGYSSGYSYSTSALKKNFKSRFEKLIDTYGSQQRGTLIQILIPKNIVDTISYKSHSYGVPATEGIDALEPIYNLTYEYKQKLLNKLYSGAFQLSCFLELYRTKPALIPNMNNIQARLLLTNQHILNPESSVIINRFTSMSPEQENIYMKEIEMFTNELLTSWFDIPEALLNLSEHNKNKREKIKALFSGPAQAKKHTPKELVTQIRELQKNRKLGKLVK